MIRFAIAAVLVPVPETEAYCYNIVKNKIKTSDTQQYCCIMSW